MSEKKCYYTLGNRVQEVNEGELKHLFGRFSKYFQCDNRINKDDNKLDTSGNNYRTTSSKVNIPPSRKNAMCFTRSKNDEQTMKLINNDVKLTSSQATVHKSINHVCDGSYCQVRWNQSSDRKNASVINENNVPSHGNSAKTTITRLRPGAMHAPGKGVDIKHNSYNRYLLRKKGKIINY